MPFILCKEEQCKKPRRCGGCHRALRLEKGFYHREPSLKQKRPSAIGLSEGGGSE